MEGIAGSLVLVIHRSSWCRFGEQLSTSSRWEDDVDYCLCSLVAARVTIFRHYLGLNIDNG